MKLRDLAIAAEILLLLAIFVGLMWIGYDQSEGTRQQADQLTDTQQQIADLDKRAVALQEQVKDLRYQLCRGLDEGRCVEVK